MKFSIITITHQDSIGLRRTLKSLAKFSKKKYEHIIIDGGSKDETLDIIREYNRRIDKWLSEPDKGIYDAMNKGIELVDNDDNIVSFLNSGDQALKNYLNGPRKCFLQNLEIDYCYGGLILVGKKKESFYMPKTFHKKKEYLQRMVFPHPALFVKKRLFSEIGNFNLKKKITADHEWCVRLIQSEARGKKLDSYLVKFRLGGASIKLSAQFEIFKTAIFFKRNTLKACLFFVRQILVYLFYNLKSKN